MSGKRAKRIRNRIKEIRKMKASDLLDNPANWRKHPEAQTAALRGIVEEVGQVDTLKAVETPKGVMLIDGHDRKGLDPDIVWDVAILNLNKKEQLKVLATFDPIGAMAQTDHDALDTLLELTEFESEALKEIFQTHEDGGESDAEDDSHLLAETLEVVIVCDTEEQQIALLDRFTEEGLKCRALVS